ncbi:hypothetical protein [Pediococcus argentinicus]|uniref:Uncharacterized protein n=1 Tax=Pediococcus argentinicus TaxID=480391 RepID=A0A0R2NI28_9LACO|nr:hypothetical protein [Pediococcus argentinicus]KRO25432.1 hypothetical protein IV88_GL000163 [Pediococcus argentinicus]NKZ22236.1 hypothetical protein [Pediococcus argentinicus]GEP19295.1 hypothetical protein LSA03_06790 [Pediococcus argentinicus]
MVVNIKKTNSKFIILILLNLITSIGMWLYSQNTILLGYTLSAPIMIILCALFLFKFGKQDKLPVNIFKDDYRHLSLFEKALIVILFLAGFSENEISLWIVIIVAVLIYDGRLIRSRTKLIPSLPVFNETLICNIVIDIVLFVFMVVLK